MVFTKSNKAVAVQGAKATSAAKAANTKKIAKVAKAPKISVIIPALNEEKYIIHPLDGLKRQSFKDFEVIVIDGNSKDKTREIAKRFGARVIVEKRRGAAIARNTGAKAARGGILVFIDADTKPTHDILKHYYDALHGNVVAATGPIYPLEKTGRRVHFAYKFITVDMVKFSIKVGFPSLVGSNLAVTKKAFDAVHGFNEKYDTCEDWDLSQRLKKHGKLAYVDGAVAYTSTRRVTAWGLKSYTMYTLDNMVRFYIFKNPNPDYEKVR